MTAAVVDELTAPSLDTVAAEGIQSSLLDAARTVDGLGRVAETSTPPSWWGVAAEAYDLERRRGVDRAVTTSSAARELAGAVDRFAAEARTAIARWRCAATDLERARAFVTALDGAVLDPRPAAAAEDDARRRIESARSEYQDALACLVRDAGAVIDSLTPPMTPTPFESFVASTSWLHTLEVDDGFDEAPGPARPGPGTNERARARGMLEAVVDTARTVPDLAVLLANHQLARTGGPRLPYLRFTFEDDLDRRLDELTGPCTLDTNPSCAISRGGGYATVVVGSAFVPTGGAVAGVRAGALGARVPWDDGARLLSGRSAPWAVRAAGDEPLDALFSASRNGSGARLPMTWQSVSAVAAKYDIPVSDLRISINKGRAGIAGITRADQHIELTRTAFLNEEQLARTLFHERFHVEQIRASGRYPAEHELRAWEDEAKAAEEMWWRSR